MVLLVSYFNVHQQNQMINIFFDTLEFPVFIFEFEKCILSVLIILRRSSIKFNEGQMNDVLLQIIKEYLTGFLCGNRLYFFLVTLQVPFFLFPLVLLFK